MRLGFTLSLAAGLILAGCASKPAPKPAPALAAPAPAEAAPTGPCGRNGDRLASVGDINMTYRQLGPAGGAPMLLILGAGQQLTDWPQDFLSALIAKGYRLTVFDNRDTGCSTHMTSAGAPNFPAINAALITRRAPPVPYTLAMMAEDVMRLMDALGMADAHIVGMAEGAVIAEMVALEQPHRVLSLTLMMASSGNPNFPTPADPVRLAGLPDAPELGAPREAILTYKVAVARALESQTLLRTEERLRAAMGESIDRKYDPNALARHSAAALTIPDLRQRLRLITAPTLVIQGDQDPIIPAGLAREVARLIPGAVFSLISEMAHDIPEEKIGEIVEAIAAIAQPPEPPA